MCPPPFVHRGSLACFAEDGRRTTGCTGAGTAEFVRLLRYDRAGPVNPSVRRPCARKSMGYRSHTWDYVLEALATRQRSSEAAAPLAALVGKLASTRYAEQLHPVLSMWTLRIYQSATYDPVRDPYIAVSFDADAGEFVIEYLAGPYRVPHSTAVVGSHWIKRSVDGLSALERCLEHLCWLT